MIFGGPLDIIVHYMEQFNSECCKSSVSDMDPNPILNMLNILSKDVLKDKLKNFQHTILIKLGRPLAIIAHYTVQFNLECCKSSVSDMDRNTILNMLNILSKDVLKENERNFQHTILMKFGGPLDIIVHYMEQFNSECCKSSVLNMGPNTISKILTIIIIRFKSEITKFNIQSL